MNSVVRPSSVEWRKAYEAHIKSAQWRGTKEALFKLRGKKCEVCGESGPRLELHHLTYERIGKELAKDLLIVCPECHEKEDRKRATVQAVKREGKRLDAAFATWCDKRGVEEPDEYEWERFNDWMERQGE